MLEAVLFASGEPVTLSRLAQACEAPESTVLTALKQLSAWYEKQKSALCVQQLGDSWQMCTHTAYAAVIERAMETKKAAPLSAAAMEVLTIVAYNQPVSKGFVEHVRGVDSSSVVNTLVESIQRYVQLQTSLYKAPSGFPTCHIQIRCRNPHLDLHP